MPEVMLADPRLSLPLRRAWTAFAAVVAVYLVVLGVGWVTHGPLLPIDVHEGIQFLLMLDAAVLVLWRALTLREDRTAWLALGVGLAAWTVGQFIATRISPDGEEVPFPSAADAGLIVFYVGQYVAFFLLARSGLRRVPRATWLDGAVGILLLGAVGAHWVFTPLLDAGGTASAAAVMIAFPAADIVLMALVICVVVLHGGHPGGVWWRIAGGVTLTALGDAVFALGSADGTAPGTTTGPLAILFSMGAACLVAAALRPTQRPRQRTLAGWPALAVPTGLFVVVLALLVLDTAGTLTPVAMALLTVAIALIGVRAAIAFRENIALADSRRQALTDELTGLPNRRSAYAELDARCEAGAVTALMIDLDRFKELNDTLGHHAGDDALVAVAQRLGRALGDDGTLSRLGGDEFAVVLGPGATESDGLAIARRLLDALDEPLYLDDLLLPVRASIGVAGTDSGRARRDPAARRRRDVPRQGQPQRGRGLRVGARRPQPRAPRAGRRAAGRDHRRRARPALPAQGLPAHRPDPRRGGPRALGAPRARPRPSGRVRAARRALRPRAAADARGDRPGPAHRARMARGRAARARGGEHLRRDAARRALPGRRRRRSWRAGTPRRACSRSS